MTRGGHREKAGRKSTWKSGCRYEETKLIRVPAAIANKLLEIAHKLDSEESLDLVTESKSDFVEQIKVAAKAVLEDEQVTRKGKDRYRVRYTLEALMKELFNEVLEIETKSKAKQTRLEL